MRISDWNSDVCSSDLADQEQDDDVESCHVRSLIASKHMVNKLRQRPETAGGNAGRLIRNGCGDKRPRKAQLRRFAEAKRRMSNWTDFTGRSEEHPSELQSLMRSSYADFCLKKKQHKLK